MAYVNMLAVLGVLATHGGDLTTGLLHSIADEMETSRMLSQHISMFLMEVFRSRLVQSRTLDRGFAKKLGGDVSYFGHLRPTLLHHHRLPSTYQAASRGPAGMPGSSARDITPAPSTDEDANDDLGLVLAKKRTTAAYLEDLSTKIMENMTTGDGILEYLSEDFEVVHEVERVSARQSGVAMYFH